MLELKNVSYKIIEKGVEKIILDNISCTFNTGEIVAITGHNGSGKSTLTKLIMGILPISSGEIIFDGVNITNMTIDERARLGLTYSFQIPITFKGVTIKELLDIASGEENTIPKACDYLSKVGLCAKDYINRDFDNTLSGGELKRIELALSVAKGGKHIIFDEPEAGIDLWSFTRLNSLFEKDKSYIVVSHQERVLERADRILVLEHGKIIAYDETTKVLNNIGPKICKRMEVDDESR